MADFFTTPGGVAVLILAQVLAVVGFVMVSLLFLVYGDRKIWAAVQMRRGPNVVGFAGLLQTVADALKYVVKEVVVPAGADKPVFMLAPMTSFVLAVIAWAVIPFSDTLVLADIALRQLAEQGPESLEALHRLPISSDLILLIFLPTLVFESAFNLDGRQLRHNLLPVLILAVPGVVLSTALMGGYSGWSHPWT